MTWQGLGDAAGGFAVALAAVLFSGAVITALYSRLTQVADRRRDRYAAAVETLVAWIEYPYRIRRRVSDDAAVLAALADLGHDLQQRLTCHETWIVGESARVADAFRKVRRTLGQDVGCSCREAWQAPPANEPTKMNLGPWGPGKAAVAHTIWLEHRIAWRFGWRRWFAWVEWLRRGKGPPGAAAVDAQVS